MGPSPASTRDGGASARGSTQFSARVYFLEAEIVAITPYSKELNRAAFKLLWYGRSTTDLLSQSANHIGGNFAIRGNALLPNFRFRLSKLYTL